MYALIENGQVTKFPYSEAELRAAHPVVSFPSPLTPDVLQEFGVVPLKYATLPSINEALETVKEAAPALVDGECVIGWDVVPLSAEEVQKRTEDRAQAVRFKRNELLAQSDWTQLADSPVNGEDWLSYRQALRDLTSQVGFPWEVTWPEEPA